MKPWGGVNSDDRWFWMNCSPACSHEGNGLCKPFPGSLAEGGFSCGKLAFKWHWALSLTKGRKLKAEGDILSLTYIFMPFIPFFPRVQIKDRGSNWIPGLSGLPPETLGSLYHQIKQFFLGKGNLGTILWFPVQKPPWPPLFKGNQCSQQPGPNALTLQERLDRGAGRQEETGMLCKLIMFPLIWAEWRKAELF